MKTIIERVNGRLYIYEESEKHFRAVGHDKRKQSVTSQDLANDCTINPLDTFFLVIDGPVYSPKKTKKKPVNKSKPVLPNFTTKDMKDGDQAVIIGAGSGGSTSVIDSKIYKKNGYIWDDLGILTETYPIRFVSRK